MSWQSDSSPFFLTKCQFSADYRATSNNIDNFQAAWGYCSHPVYRCESKCIVRDFQEDSLKEPWRQLILLSPVLSVIWNVDEMVRTLTFILDHEVTVSMKAAHQKWYSRKIEKPTYAVTSWACHSSPGLSNPGVILHEENLLNAWATVILVLLLFLS